MVKSFLIILICQIFIFADEQIVLVVAKSVDSKKAALTCYENGRKIFDSFEVNAGANGFGVGAGGKRALKSLSYPLKLEGDKKTPLGIFTLDAVFGYEKELQVNMPYIHASKDLVCIDDSGSGYYNKIIAMPKAEPKSFEFMKREDDQYALGVVVGYNKEGFKQRGSCIFLHVQKAKGSPTAGCISMSLKELKKIVSWLDKRKNPILIQITQAQKEELFRLYPALRP